MEITTRFLGSNVDVLGYAFDPPSRLHQKLTAYREARRIRAERILEKLDQLGMKLSMEEVLVFSADGVIARPHTAKTLVQKGYAPDVQTVFDLYLADLPPSFRAIGKTERSSGVSTFLSRPKSHPPGDQVRSFLQKKDFWRDQILSILSRGDKEK